GRQRSPAPSPRRRRPTPPARGPRCHRRSRSGCSTVLAPLRAPPSQDLPSVAGEDARQPPGIGPAPEVTGPPLVHRRDRLRAHGKPPCERRQEKRGLVVVASLSGPDGFGDAT